MNYYPGTSDGTTVPGKAMFHSGQMTVIQFSGKDSSSHRGRFFKELKKLLDVVSSHRLSTLAAHKNHLGGF